MGERYFAAQTHTHLGDTYAAMGDRERARSNWYVALELLDQPGHPDIDEVHRRLSTLSTEDTG